MVRPAARGGRELGGRCHSELLALSHEGGVRVGHQRSGCQDGVKPAGALLGVVPWKGNRREQEEGWTLRRKRLEEGGEARANTGSPCCRGRKQVLRRPPCGCHQSQERRDCVGGQPCLPPPGSLTAKACASLPSILLLDPVSRCLHPPLPHSSPLHLFQACLVSKAFSPPASLVISPPHFP